MTKEFFKVLDVEQVLDFVSTFPRVAPETVALGGAFGRVLAADIAADAHLPAFGRSVVDGFAVHAASTFGAADGSPALLQIVGAVAMGQTPSFSIAPGQAARIATGGVLPEGADSAVMLEHAEELDETSIEVFRSVAPGQNVVAAGEDFNAGDMLLARGRRIRAQDAGVLAAFGHSQLAVYRRPVVGIISTGDEIVPVESEPEAGQVRDVNTYTLAGLVSAGGAQPYPFGIVPDAFASLKAACETAIDRCDAVLISGGSSVGTRDFTVDVIRAFEGSEILAHGVAISPGKPTILARVRNKPFWGIPGHVVSAMIVFSRIVRPFLDHIGGLADPRSGEVRLSARLSRNIASVQGRTDFVRVRTERRGGSIWAEPVLGKSALIHTMVKADGIIEVGKNVEGLNQGEAVEVILF
jgi:molybdopterin molybdotransferase